LGYFYLGRWPFVFKTMIAALLFSVLTNVAVAYLPGYLDRYPITDDLLLSSIYAGMVSGIGYRLIYRSQLSDLKSVVKAVDPQAFVSISVTAQAVHAYQGVIGS